MVEEKQDLPTLPLKNIQTPGGYRAIRDAEDRHVAFMSMSDKDRQWGDFLIRGVNNHEALVEELRHSALAVHTIGAYHNPSWVAFEECQKEICVSARKVLAAIDSQ